MLGPQKYGGYKQYGPPLICTQLVFIAFGVVMICGMFN